MGLMLPNVLDDCLYKMRPSDRETLKLELANPAHAHLVVEAIMRYVERWERSDWVEAYSVSRIGKWFAREAGADRVAELRKWAGGHDSEARNALKAGLNAPKRPERPIDELRTFSPQI